MTSTAHYSSTTGGGGNGEHVDFFDYFFNSEGLPEFVTQDDAGSNFTFSVDLEGPGSLPVAGEFLSSLLPASEAPSAEPTTPEQQDEHEPAYIKEEPYSPGSSSDSGGGDEYVETVKLEVVTAPLCQTFANEAAVEMDAASCSTSKRRPLKRSRESSPTPTLSAEQMRKLSNGANIIEAGKKSLTADEERQLKRQRRLIKNRESAQKSRQRRKMYIEELEQKVTLLVSQNDRLHQENKILREDLEYLSSILKKTSNLPDQLLSKPVAAVTPRSVKAAGVCLLIVLFSFGLFFNSKNSNGPHGLPSLPFDRALSLPLPATEPIPPEVLSAANDKRHAGRLLKSVKDGEPDNAELKAKALTEIYPERNRKRAAVNVNFFENSKDQPFIIQDDEPESVMPTVDSNPVATTASTTTATMPASRVVQAEQPQKPLEEVAHPSIKKQKKPAPILMDLSKEEEEEEVVIRSGSVTAQQPAATSTSALPGPSTRSFFFCTEAREVVAADDANDNASTVSAPSVMPRSISVLVPLEALSNDSTASEEGGETNRSIVEQALLRRPDPSSASSPSIVEVSCQVLNMNIYPHVDQVLSVS